MDEELKKELSSILSNLPTENSWLDYKGNPYKTSDIGGLINDLSAFLNSEQSYGMNKYIIYGVDNKRNRRGIEKDEMLDDHYFQDAATHIFPVPKIITGTFEHTFEGQTKIYGYIQISKDNIDRVYEVKKDTITNKDDGYYTKKDIFNNTAIRSTAWIRIGSKKDYLDEYTRRKIYEFDNNKKNFLLNDESVYINKSELNNIKNIKAALLFGKWNENNTNDKKIIERYIGISYDEFIEQFRMLAKKENNFVFKNGVWKINNRNTIIKRYALDYYKDDFDNFYSIIVEILNEKHPKLDLSPDKRNMFSIYGKITKYSDEIRSGVAEGLAILESIKNDFKNCRIDVSNFVILVVRKVLENSDWYIWASLDRLLPYLAEASMTEFINQLEDYLSSDNGKKIMLENEIGISIYNYSTSIYWSLELIAWNTDHFVQACMILSKLAKYDEKAIDHIVNIILPWHPNTYAPFSFRLALVENILRENLDVGWKVLKKLMPGAQSYAVPTYKPRYINIPDDDMSVTNEEYYEQVNTYLDLMIKYCKVNDDRLIDLIDLLDNVSKDNFDKICKYLKSSKIMKKSDKSKYKLWDRLERLIHWINKHSDINDNIKIEMTEKINAVITYVKPKNVLYVVSRLFKKDTWGLIDNYDDYKSSEKQLHDMQLNSIKEVLSNKDLNLIMELVNIVEDAYSLGMVFSKLNITTKDEKNIIISNLNKEGKISDFTKGYVYNKYNLNGEKYNIENLQKLPLNSKVKFLLMLPYNMLTFKNVEILLGRNYKEYWEQVDIRYIDEDVPLNYSVEKLIEVGRYERVLWMYRLSLHNNKNIIYDNDVVLTCLENISNNCDQYDICEAIEDLQKNNADKDRLFYIEWKFLPLLSHGDYRPITMEKEIATNVNRYVEILELAFKEHSKAKDNRNIDLNIATNAYRLLHQWKYVPGTKKDCYIDGVKLKKWFEDMQKMCIKKDRLEVGLSCFGNVLFYSPMDSKGFWIDKTVAEILNGNETIRNGYKNEAFNSLGVVNWDEKGTDYIKKRDEYQQKANDTELAGYYNFAIALREIARNFEFQAEHMEDTYPDF